MSNLKEIKGRIASVQSTQKITSAMRMVSSAKLHRTQTTTQNFLVYQRKLQEIMQCLGYQSTDASADSNSNSSSGSTTTVESAVKPGMKHVLLIPVASNSGLCGAFNSNMLKATLKRKEEWEAQGMAVTLMPVGKKVNHSLQHEGFETAPYFVNLLDKMGKEDIFPKVVALVTHIREMQSADGIDEVEFIYHHFKSMGSQKIQIESVKTTYTEKAKTSKEKAADAKFLTEPSSAELVRIFFPRMVNAKVYGMMLDSVTSEHAARMLAMQTADDNAQELTQELTLLYNKTRQQSITNELIDIMSGKTGS